MGVPVSANLARAFEPLDGSGLLGVRVLDGLRFVEDDQIARRASAIQGTRSSEP